MNATPVTIKCLSVMFLIRVTFVESNQRLSGRQRIAKSGFSLPLERAFFHCSRRMSPGNRVITPSFVGRNEDRSDAAPASCSIATSLCYPMPQRRFAWCRKSFYRSWAALSKVKAIRRGRTCDPALLYREVESADSGFDGGIFGESTGELSALIIIVKSTLGKNERFNRRGVNQDVMLD